MELKPPPPLSSGGAPSLPFLARLAEAVQWTDAVRRHEDDPWAYMRRKLQSAAGPLKELKQSLFDKAKAALFADLQAPIIPPGALERHRELFEMLMMPGDFADLAINLLPGGDPKQRLAMCKMVLDGAISLTLFDVEALPELQRGNAWQKRVLDLGSRLDLPRLGKAAERGEGSVKRKAYYARRLRRNLGEYLTVTRHEGGVREEITVFTLVRVEAAVAATLRFLARWP